MPRGLGLYNPYNVPREVKRAMVPRQEFESPAAPGERECIICMERSVKTVMIDCGHSVMCVMCCRKIMIDGDQKCPICKATVSRAIKLFMC
jgi:hypothetical protein